MRTQTITLIDQSDKAPFVRFESPSIMLKSAPFHRSDFQEMLGQIRNCLKDTPREVQITVKPAEPNAYSIAKRWPRLTAHVICESLGYCTPESAAAIIWDGKLGRPNWCEMIWACYKGDARAFLRKAIRGRKYHFGYMAHYPYARAIVKRFIATGDSPEFASWF